MSVDLSQALGANTDPTTGSGLLAQLGAIAGNLSSASPSTSGLSSALSGIQSGLSALSSLATHLAAATDQMTMASTTISDMQTSVTSDLSNDEDANMARTMTTYSNEEAAFTAALKAGASIVQTSLMDFLTG